MERVHEPRTSASSSPAASARRGTPSAASPRRWSSAKSRHGLLRARGRPWSGAEKGGETSGRHLGENFAHGMLEARADVEGQRQAPHGHGASSTATWPTRQRHTKTTVVNNYYSLGDVKIDASSISEFMTLNDFFQTVRKAKAGM
ncbi:MAG: hypothetical protein ACLTYW_00070 [Collinsella sp.]